MLEDPKKPGAFVFEKVVYAGSNLSYSGSQANLSEYSLFETPTPQFETNRLNIEPFGFVPNAEWPFDEQNSPINGIALIPEGVGPFPLVVFAHGNHEPFENSTLGYLYLCELLASHGIIAVTIDVNFLNGRNRGENDARAIVHLEHIKQFNVWNLTPGHPLFGKVNLDKVIIAGHSRGGEGVGHASFFNKLKDFKPESYSPVIPFDGTRGFGPYGFGIQAIIAIAPTDLQYAPRFVTSEIQDNFFIIHGSSDGDVSDFQGYKTYDRTHSKNSFGGLDGKLKALLWVHKANHNFFNSRWGQESAIDTLSRSNQEGIAKVYIGAIARAFVLGEVDYLSLLQNHDFGVNQGWIPSSINLVSQYEGSKKAYMQNFAGSYVDLSSPFQGRVDIKYMQADLIPFYFDTQQNGISLLDRNKHLYQETKGMRLEWASMNGVYKIFVYSLNVPIDDFSYLSFRVGQSFESPNIASIPQDFSVEIFDGTHHFQAKISTLNTLLFPANALNGMEPKTVMQTVKVYFSDLEAQQLDIRNLKEITFKFDQPLSGTNFEQGVVYLGGIFLGG